MLLPSLDYQSFPTAKHLRHELVSRWLTSLPNNSSILDAGAGIMRYKRYCSHLNYTSQDFGEFTGDVGQFASKWDSTQCDIISDISNIPAKTSSFDFILCSEVLEHLPEPSLALRELTRLVKHSGYIFVTVPFACSAHQEPFFYSSGYSRQWFELFADRFRLEIVNIIEYGSYLSKLTASLDRINSILGSTPKVESSIANMNDIIRNNIEFLSLQFHHSPESLFVLLKKV